MAGASLSSVELHKKAKWLGAAFVALGAFAGPMRDGRACGNEVEIKIDPHTRAVQTAERALERGEWRAALKLAAPVMAARKGKAEDNLARRASGVAILAVTRSEGRYGFDGAEISEAERRMAEISRAVSLSEELSARKKDDVTVRTNHAEVLSHLPERRGEALRTLAELEGADLVSSAHAYAALARLRGQAPSTAPAWVAPALVALEDAKAKVAVARCKRMASNKEICPV